jgi:hypothetical protein
MNKKLMQLSGMFGIDPADADAGLFQDPVKRKPVDPGRIHGHGAN